jgi:hypothetical protein
VWGNNGPLNSAIPGSVPIVGATLTGSDKLALNTYIEAYDKIVKENDAKIPGIEAKIKANKALIDAKSKKTTVPTPKTKTTTDPSATTTTFLPPPEFPTPDYQWNLPPHAWSLPTDPGLVNPGFSATRSDSFHTTRRGRIWYFQGYVGPTNVPDFKNTGIIKTDAQGNALTAATVNKYGFQFIWNPETFTQQTQVNMSVTPSNTDPTIGLTGFAAANSSLQFTIRLDRTNDFACAKSIVNIEDLAPALSDVAYDRNQVLKANQLKSAADIVPFYSVGSFSTNTVESVESKIFNLLKYGTEFDLEYLYRTVNGDGWKGIGGRETSNIGYLMPALIRVDLGNQKFVGVVSSVSVNHLAFTRDLVPIRTDVNLTIDLRANIQPTTNAGTQ